ncbi:MAG: hypothetical protein OHK0017_03940 [Patescibacteria group bacterium]
MKTVSQLSHQTLLFLARKIYKKFRDQAIQQKGKAGFKTVLVAGTVGKTSQMLVLNQGYQKLGYDIWTGTSLNKNLNTLTGLIMVLGEFRTSLEKSGLIGKLGFILKATQIWLFKKWSFGPKPLLLLFEVGPDHQYEIDEFVSVFRPSVDAVVITSLTGEHLAGFKNVFNLADWQKVQEFIPPQYLSDKVDFEQNQDIPNTQKNCYIDQLKLLEIAKNYYIPAKDGLEPCDIIRKLENNTNLGPAFAMKIEACKKPSVKRDAEFRLIVGKNKLNSRYLVPLSFSRQIFLAQLLLLDFGLSANDFNQMLQELQLPNSRFGFFDGHNKSKIVDSSYNNDPASADAFLSLLLEVRPGAKDILVLGEMRELGENATEEHQKIINKLKDIASNSELKVILLGHEWQKCSYNRKEFKTFQRVGQIINYFKRIKLSAENWVWIKGSQNTIFLEALVEHLLEDKKESEFLGRRGQDWDQIRAPYLQN